jgi:hypothetical protein
MTDVHAAAIPFYSSGRAGPRGRLLLLSYHFPPSIASGALRWQKLASHAAERGWGMDIVALEPTEVERADPERVSQLPQGIRLYGVSARPPVLDRTTDSIWHTIRGAAWGGANGRRVASRHRSEARTLPGEVRDVVRAYHAWRAHAREHVWARTAERVATRILETARPAAIITCGPPHGVHDAGRRLAARSGIPFIADFRDPWSLKERLPETVASPLWWLLARRAERHVVKRAALIVMNTDAARRAMTAKYPAAAARTISVLNGVDRDDVIPRVRRPARFTLAHTGTIYIDRDPRPLFRGAGRLIRRLHLSPNDFGLELMGNVASYGEHTLRDLATEVGIERFVTVHEPRPRADALRLMARSQMLVSLPQDSHLAVPAKIYEYLRFRAWLLALAEEESATAEVLRETGADVVSPRDEDGIARVIQTRYEAWRCGAVPDSLLHDDRLTRRAQAQRLFDAIDQTLSHGTEGGKRP